MSIHESNRLIVAGVMASVIAVAVMVFALRAPAESSVTAAPPPPAAAGVTATATPDAAAPNPGASKAVAQTLVAAASAGLNESVISRSTNTSAPSAVTSKPARNRPPSRTDDSVVAAASRSTPAASTTTNSAETAIRVASNTEGFQGAGAATPPVALGISPADDQKTSTIGELAASDSQITTNVKSAIAGDGVSGATNIAVTTTHGVVVLTGSVANQRAIEQVKDVAEKVKDVKSVDTSALTLASL